MVFIILPWYEEQAQGLKSITFKFLVRCQGQSSSVSVSTNSVVRNDGVAYLEDCLPAGAK